MQELTLLQLEPKISKELIKENITEKVIEHLRLNYGNLKLKSLEDKETYIEIKNAKKVVAKVRTTATKVCKAGREEAIREQKLWIEAEKKVIGKIKEVEDVLDAEIEKFETEEARKEAEEKERKESAYINRQAELTKMGATYSNGSFVLGDVSFEATLIKDADEDIYAETILPKYKEVYEVLEAERIEKERVASEKAAELKRQQEELEQKQREFEQKQAEFKRQQEELEQRQKLIQHRSTVLSSLGMIFNGNEYFFEDVNVHNTEIVTLDESKWVELIQKITPLINEKKAEKIKADEEAKALELAQSDDKTKWAAFIEQLNNLVHQEMKSPKYKRMQQIAKEKLEEIKSL